MEFENHRSFVGYLSFIFKTPLAAWWASAAGLLGIIRFILLTPTVSLGRVSLTAIIFSSSLFLFVAVSIMFKAWPLYTQRRRQTVTQIVKADNECVFLVDGLGDAGVGTLLEIYRKRESIEVPIGFIEVTHQRSDGLYQAKAVWIMPVHLRDIETRELSHDSIFVYGALSASTLSRLIDQKAETMVQDLMRRGINT